MKNNLEKTPHLKKTTVIGPEVMMSVRMTQTGVLGKNPALPEFHRGSRAH